LLLHMAERRQIVAHSLLHMAAHYLGQV
jgi:hypothetical protein